jgi:hypothetical protein
MRSRGTGSRRLAADPGLRGRRLGGAIVSVIVMAGQSAFAEGVEEASRSTKAGPPRSLQSRAPGVERKQGKPRTPAWTAKRGAPSRCPRGQTVATP